MVAPLVGLAVGAAARAVAKKVASNAVKSAATKKLVKETAKKKPLTTPKSNVTKKPAAKSVSNPPDKNKVLDKQLRRSFGSEGEERTGRKELIQIKKLASEKSPAKRPSNWGTGANRVMINSAKTTRVVKVNPKKK